MTICALVTLATLIRYQFGIVIVMIGIWTFWYAHTSHQVGTLKLLGAGVIAISATFGIIQFQIASTFRDSPPIGQSFAGKISFETNDFERSIRKILIYDIVGIIAGNQDVPLAVLADLNLDVPKFRATAVRLYSSYNVDSLWEPNGVFSQLLPVSTSQIWSQWANSIVNSPRAFATHRFKTFGRFLGFGDIYKCFPIVVGIYDIPQDFARDLGANTYRQPYSAKVIRNKNIPVRILFSPILYAAISIFLIAFFLLSSSGSAEGAALVATGLIYEATFFALPQSCGVNYSYFMILTTIFGSAITAFHYYSLGVRSLTH